MTQPKYKLLIGKIRRAYLTAVWDYQIAKQKKQAERVKIIALRNIEGVWK